jgi:hypothetical protein
MARKKANIHYIYKTTCSVTGKWYVGMHSTSNENDGYMGSGTVLRRSIRKYGVENHTKEILEYCDTREALVLREIEIVSKDLISDGFCMNLKEGGQGGFSSEEHIINCSKAGVKAKQERLNNDLEFKTKNDLILLGNVKKAHKMGKYKYESFKGKSHSDETKQLMSESSKGQGTGEANSQYGTCWVTKDGISKKIKKENLEDYLLDNWNKGRK